MELRSIELLATSSGALALFTVTSYLDFNDFLCLSGISHRMRDVLLSHYPIWRYYYEIRVGDYTKSLGLPHQSGYIHNGNGHPFSSSHSTPIATDSAESFPYITSQLSNYKCDTICIKRNVVSTDWFRNLVVLARFAGIVLQASAAYKNPFLELAVKSSAAVKMISLHNESIRTLVSTGSLVLAAPDIYSGNDAPFTIVNKTTLCYYDCQHKYNNLKITLPQLDETRIHVLFAKWMRSIDCTQCKKLDYCDDIRYVEDNTNPRLMLIYRIGKNDTAASVYEYGADGFSKRPVLTRKVPDTSSEISCVDSVRCSFCEQYTIYLGYSNGNVCEIYPDNVNNLNVADEGIVSLMQWTSNNQRILAAWLSNGNVEIFRYSNCWEPTISIRGVSILTVNPTTSVIGYCNSGRCKVMFRTLHSPDVEIGVSRPPSSIICLYRKSLWAIVIRNYLKLVEVCATTSGVAVRHVRALNGHGSDITGCHSDGWHRLLSIDTSHILIMWDFVQGVKLMSIPLLRQDPPVKVPHHKQEKSHSIKAHKKPSVNRQVSYPSIYNAKKNFNVPPQKAMLASDDSESDDFVDSVGSMSLRNTRPSDCKYHIHALPHAICIFYYHTTSLHLVSFK
ncbi:uncharacterized protein BBOV_IV011030 [Babesia bovis T2Bo]|uniref:F-box domain-containing protein n=1 Tax=Babesia bovis TaxID=5865 RepID=A7ASD7_BABBO|nr:uncharacterized protein BBOV_IV011030 [Babesia bovis T2Bo]EDO07456.1 hypothetical protein BBOV_IV011030 [Babesia bovis T2Bo]|eukprot:XP_001611024.1 hypothetical protein [Babesia bovis T2Bo]